MVGPYLPGGLRLRLTGDIGSRPYIHLTLELDASLRGRRCERGRRDVIGVAPGGYRPADYEVESDWSAASYWYALVALGPAGSEHRAAGAAAGVVAGRPRDSAYHGGRWG
ncbi:MAG: hypothetical protein WKG07_46785 [Hymenobacter sp.]